MNMEQLANFAEVIGVALVIASLIYVAKQLRQTTEALHAQSRQSVLNGSQAELFVLVADPALAKSFVDGYELSPDDNIRLPPNVQAYQPFDHCLPSPPLQSAIVKRW